MSYFISENTQIRKMDSTCITDGRYKGPVSQSVSPFVHDRLTWASQSDCLSRRDILTYITIIYTHIYIYIYILYIYIIVMYVYVIPYNTFLFRRFKNIRKMNSTYITEYGYNGLASQPVSQSANQSVSLSLTVRLTYQWLISFQKIKK